MAFFIVVSVMLISLSIILKSDTLNHKAISFISESVRKQTGATLSLSRISYTPYSNITLNDLLILDQANDTLLYSKEVKFNIGIKEAINGSIHLKSLSLSHALARIIKNQETFNYDFIVKRLNNKDSNNKNAFTIKEVNLNNFSFSYEDIIAQSKTKVYTDRLELTAEQMNIEDKTIIISDGLIENTSYEIQKSNNAHYQEHYESNDSFPKADWHIEINHVTVINSAFAIENGKNHKSKEQINLDNLLVSSINVNSINTVIDKDSITFSIEQLSLEESSGFKLNELDAGLTINTNKSITLKDFVLETPGSAIKSKYLKVENINKTSEEVQVYLDIAPSVISPIDLSFFDSDFDALNSEVIISGLISGRINNLKAQKVLLRTGNQTKFAGNAKIKGLPNLKTAFIDLDIRETLISAGDIKCVYPTAEINQQLFNLGLVSFKGRFTGFHNDFVAYGKMNSSLGKVNSDLNVKSKGTEISYSGGVDTRQFNIGQLLNEKRLGSISMQSEIKGSGLTTKNLRASLNGHIDAFDFNQYTYSNIELMGDISGKKFDGSFTIKDANLDMLFEGKIDLNLKVPEFIFNTTLNHANLQALKITEHFHNVSATANLNFTGANIDDIEGSIILNKLNVRRTNDTLKIDTLFFTTNFANDKKQITLRSDIVDADLSGDFKIKTLPEKIKNAALYYIRPNEFRQKDKESAIASFNIQIKKADNLIEFFNKDIHLRNTAFINGAINTNKNYISLKAETNDLEYKNINFTNIDFSLLPDSNKNMGLACHIEHINLSDKLQFNNNILSATLSSSNASFSLLADHDSSGNDILLSGNLEKESDKLKLHFDPSKSNIKVNNKIWSINPSNQITYQQNNITLADLSIGNGNQEVTLEAINKKEVFNINTSFENIIIGDFSQIINKSEESINGTLNGQLDISSDLALQSHLHLKNFSISNDTLGDAEIQLSKSTDNSKVFLQTNILGYEQDLTCNGYYVLGKDSLNFNIATNNMPIFPIETYFQNKIDSLSGNATVKLLLTGTIQNPVLNGTVILLNAKTRVVYLNTVYQVPIAEVLFKKNEIDIDKVLVKDELGNIALIEGNATHQYFKSLEYDLYLSTDQFMFLNTNAQQNKTYYGTAIADIKGKMHLTGGLRDIDVDADAITQEGTHIFIPISDDQDLSEHGFIKFKYKSQNDNSSKEDENKDLSYHGLTLNLRLDITPQAKGEIIFDLDAGDIIKAQGTGNINMRINTLGEVNMFGTYTIEKGNYLFTMQSPVEGLYLVKKRFIIDNGSMLKWSGSPYDASIDIDAIYNLRATLPDNTANRVSTDVKLNLEGSLLSPKVTFDIQASGAEDQGIPNSIFERIKRDEAELNRQVFGLIVLNRFLPSDLYGDQFLNEQQSSTSVSSFISRELSTLASNLSDEIDFNVNLYSYGTLNNSDNPENNTNRQQEVQLGVSRRFMDNRLSVDVGGNFRSTDEDIGQGQSGSNISGDFNIEYSLTKDGRLRLKAFRKNAYDLFFERNQNKTGIGFFYREQFDSFRELWEGYRRNKKDT